MKLLIQIFAVLAALTSFALADDKSVCAGKNKHVMNAIQNFCGPIGNNLNVPSGYATKGAKSTNGGAALVSISGGCQPVQWVPQNYCYSQMYHVCATGDKKGHGSLHYGNHGCQEWDIIQN